MSFRLISDNDHRPAELTAANRALFRGDALQIRMYFVPEGETILITLGQEALLMEGGTGRTLRNQALAQAIAGELNGRQLRAIIASHPHRDHTNSHSNLVGLAAFAPGARYFDNGIPAANENFQRITNDNPPLPFQRVAVLDNAQNAESRIVRNFGGVDADLRVLRSSTGATTHAGQVYWPVFSFLRIRNAWMLFTGDLITQLYQANMTPRLQAINARTHFLQLSHHGNRTGTSEDFVAAMRPAIAAASTGDDAGHHLDNDVRARLAAVNSQVLATFDPGPDPVPANVQVQPRDIVIRTDGFIWNDGISDGVLFEVVDLQPAL